eukprot:gene14576-19575_t
MKFRSKISKDLLTIFQGIIITLGRISDRGIIYLDERSVRISPASSTSSSIHIGNGDIETIKCFCELNAAVLFVNYRIESQSNNSILFEISFNQLAKALQSGRSSSFCYLKLVKRNNQPCLSFETKANESIACSMDVVHDIPIKLMKSDDIIYYLPPDIPPPQVAVDLLKNKIMKIVLDKMVKFSKHLIITAKQSGSIIFRVDHNSAVIQSYFNGLQSRLIGNITMENVDNASTVKVNMKKFSIITNLGALIYDYASLYVTDNSPLLLHVTLTPYQLGSLTYYLPVMINDDEDDENGEIEVNGQPATAQQQNEDRASLFDENND